MARSGKQGRVTTSGGADLSQDNPFAALSTDGLTAGPGASAPSGQSGAKAASKRGTLTLRRLKAGRGGKVVTEISGFGPQEGLDALLRSLQARLGTGGTRRGDVLEIQGERREQLKGLLEAEGYRVKGVPG
jgi:translation initiation factor 1 (eIF-1/SUI1)